MLRRPAMVLIAFLLVACGGGPGPATSVDPTIVPTVPELIAALSDPDAAVRLDAAQQLGARGDARAVPALAVAADDVDYDVSRAALDALATIGGAAAEEALLGLAVDPPKWNDSVGQAWFEAVVIALGKVAKSPEAITRLVELAAGDDFEIGDATDAAGDALDALGNAALPGLLAVLEGSDTGAQLEAIARLGPIGGTEAVAALEGLLGSEDMDIQAAAIEALGRAGDPSVAAALVKALGTASTRGEATSSLIALFSDDATPLLKYLKSKDTVAVYRPLIRIGQEGTEAALVTALTKFGTKSMAEAYLNCGNDDLEKAARAWAKKHGYTVVTLPGGGEVTWGQ